MRAVRTAVAVVLFLAALAVTTGPAGAGESPVSASLTAVCNPDTGDYQVTLTVGALRDVTLDIGRFYAYDSNEVEITKGTLTFDPTEIGPGVDSVVIFSSPATPPWSRSRSTRSVPEARSPSSTSPEPCSTEPTTPPTQPVETTTTAAPTAAAATAAAASPRFTG